MVSCAFPFPSSLSLGLVALLSLSGCGFSGPTAGNKQAADTDQRIVVDNFRAPVANWALESDAAYILSLSGCLETLTRYDESQGKIVPLLATEWKQVLSPGVGLHHPRRGQVPGRERADR